MKTKRTLLDNGCVVRVSGKKEMYLVQRGELHLIPNLHVYKSLYADKDVVKNISIEELLHVCVGQPLSEDARLIKASGNAIYFNTNNTKSHIRSAADFNLAGFDWNSVKIISDDEMDKIKTIRDFVIEQNKVISIYEESIPKSYNQRIQDIDYGILKMHEKFVIDNEERTASILLPPNYNSKEKYPILFLYHGLGGTSEELINYGAQIIIGNLIHEDKMQSCITVFPDIFLYSDNQEQRRKKYREYRKILVEELLPYMKTSYSVKDGGDNTAIGGLSMGGYAALYNDWLCCTRCIDAFHYIGVFGPSPALLMLIGDPDKFILPHSDGCFTFISRGSNDSIVNQEAKLYSDTLTKNGIDNVYVEYENGDHGSDTMSRLLYQFLSYDFFRKK